MKLFALFILFTVSSCAHTKVKTEYRNEYNIIVSEDSISKLNIFKELRYENQELKTVEIFLNRFSKLDTLGRPTKSLIGAELYNVPLSEKAKVLSKYPQNSWSFKLYFVERVQYGEYFADYKQLYISEKPGYEGYEKHENFLLDNQGRTICYYAYELRNLKKERIIIEKFFFGNFVLIGSYDEDGNAKYCVYEKTIQNRKSENSSKSKVPKRKYYRFENEQPIECFDKNDFEKMKNKYFLAADINYYTHIKLEPTE